MSNKPRVLEARNYTGHSLYYPQRKTLWGWSYLYHHGHIAFFVTMDEALWFIENGSAKRIVHEVGP